MILAWWLFSQKEFQKELKQSVAQIQNRKRVIDKTEHLRGLGDSLSSGWLESLIRRQNLIQEDFGESIGRLIGSTY